MQWVLNPRKVKFLKSKTIFIDFHFNPKLQNHILKKCKICELLPLLPIKPFFQLNYPSIKSFKCMKPSTSCYSTTIYIF